MTLTFALVVGLLTGCTEAPEPQEARDATLRALRVLLYRAADSTRPPRAVVFFFGNDVGFWGPHRELAAALARKQIAVAGFDIRSALNALPDSEGLRERTWSRDVNADIALSREELGGAGVPLILAGHSLGAEIAIWTAAYARPPGVVGVLAISPGSRSHLRVSLSDLAMMTEPTGPGSFSVADAVRALPDSERCAIVRGDRDKFGFADSTLIAAGAPRARKFNVLFSGHSMKSLLMSLPVITYAIDWILTRP